MSYIRIILNWHFVEVRFSLLVSLNEKTRFSLTTYFQPALTSNLETKIQQHAGNKEKSDIMCAFQMLQQRADTALIAKHALTSEQRSL